MNDDDDRGTVVGIATATIHVSSLYHWKEIKMVIFSKLSILIFSVARILRMFTPEFSRIRNGF